MKSVRKKAAPKSNPDEKLIEQLAERIKQLRKAKGYTSYEYFAYEHNISRTQFGRYEKGQNLRYTSLFKVAKAFGMSLSEFFSEGFD
jgi:transcriptional regulator with XRE-family HTH domain